MKRSSPGWFVRYRQGWIAEMLHVYGFVNREHLMRKFGMSQPQASADLQQFLQQHPGRMEYDLVRKVYVATGRVNPRIATLAESFGARP